MLTPELSQGILGGLIRKLRRHTGRQRSGQFQGPPEDPRRHSDLLLDAVRNVPLAEP